MSLNNLTISRKLVFAFAGVVSIILVMCGVVLFELHGLEQTSAAEQKTRLTFEAASAIELALVEQQNASRGFVAGGAEDFVRRFDDHGAAADEALARLSGLVDAPIEQTHIADLQKAIGIFRAENLRNMAASRDPATRQSALSGVVTVGRLSDTRKALKILTDDYKAELTARVKERAQSRRQAALSLYLGGALAALLAGLMGWMLTRAISKPVSAMTTVMGRLAGGDNDVEIPGVGRKDEIGSMAAAVETFRQAAIERVALQAQAAEQRRVADENRSTAEAERARAADEQDHVVQSIAGGLSSLADGVLTARINQAFAPAYEKLRADFNSAMEKMQDSMRIVATNTAGVRSASGEISQASDDLSRRTEQQAASLEETAAALDEITATVRRTAEGAGHAREMVANAKADAERSSEVVGVAVSAMGEIEGSARQISQIIGVIDEIAFQTNLLALNAGVEAARAGDAGKGFAVVASEVRALAQRSAEAAKEIKTLISASSQQVDRGVSLVGETGKALERIVTQVGEINGVVSEIAASAQEQATGLQQVNTAVNQMDQVTQQNAAMVEQSTAASHTLASEAEQLSNLIARFDLGMAAATAAPVPLAVKRPAPAKTHIPVPAMRTTGVRGGAAPRLHIDADSEAGWDEF